VIDHVLKCLVGCADNIIESASVLPAMELTLDVRRHLAQQPAQPKQPAVQSRCSPRTTRATYIRHSGPEGVDKLMGRGAGWLRILRRI